MIKTPSKPVTKNNRIVTLFFILISASLGLSTILLNALNLKWVFYLEVALLTADFVFFAITWRSKASYIYKDTSIQFIDLLETFDPESICPFCEVIRLPRSRHCNICNRCVERYDHHCPWVNNCIGKANHFPFYMHLLHLTAYIITATSSAAWTLVNANDIMPDSTVQTGTSLTIQ